MTTVITTPVWVLDGLTGSTPGEMQFQDGRVKLIIEELHVFNVPLTEVKNVNFPWHYFGGGVKFTVGAENYRISFTESGEYGDISTARLNGKIWKGILP